MDCEEIREAISAEIDGHGDADRDVATHLDACAACRAWRTEAMALAVSPAMHAIAEMKNTPPPSDLVPRGFHRNRWLRILLAWAGVLLLFWNVPGMITGPDDGSAVHLFRHQSAFSAALGVTFLVVAWRPDRAYGLVPFAAAFTVALSATAVIDLAAGSSDPGPEARHLVEIAGLVALWVLGAGAGPARRAPRWRRRTRRIPPVAAAQDPDR